MNTLIRLCIGLVLALGGLAALPPALAQDSTLTPEAKEKEQKERLQLAADGLEKLYKLQPDSKATVDVSGQIFNLFTQNDAAWLDDAGQSSALASAIRAGSSMTVEGTTAAGIKVTQNYSLSGATAAQQSIGNCS